ncbi:SOS response-associated peptidase [Sulfurirhabdus autotrophica]|uniref:Abasic site processing protein n=1 Tax=Sulfurirhabdus autotrophica TaxID=1706046 RepID=A0A4R3XY54_9PROT|nr:SOS response-associated peptidase [Sulfurirhabdus autotrophica]TCV82724.1 putative SOS response-associated peptidase YedK [Sulfurirhabdus autotrophica]
MCGRYTLYGSPAKLKEHFATTGELDFKPRYNIAPTQAAPVVRLDETGNRVFTLARWGLIPSWVKDSEEIQHPINAKAETAAIKPMFRHAYRNSRVLVPADAFYEWVPKNGKQPYLIRLRDGEPMGMGGLLEHWQGPEGEVKTFTILTTEANSLMAKIHTRMPVIIRPKDYIAWIDTNLTDVTKIQAMAQPYPDRLMEAYPVSRKVNSPQHDSSDLIEPTQE